MALRSYLSGPSSTAACPSCCYLIPDYRNRLSVKQVLNVASNRTCCADFTPRTAQILPDQCQTGGVLQREDASSLQHVRDWFELSAGIVQIHVLSSGTSPESAPFP